LTHAEVRRWLESRRWIFARSRPTNPHSYTLRREADDEAMFEAVVEHIREFGQPYPWWGTIYIQYVAGTHAYWTMGAAVKDTLLINRKTLERVRLDQLTNKGSEPVDLRRVLRRPVDVGAQRYRAGARLPRFARDPRGLLPGGCLPYSGVSHNSTKAITANPSTRGRHSNLVVPFLKQIHPLAGQIRSPHPRRRYGIK
jgi:hypothetical protein